jgi:membrane protein YdbS with pleckstrin-like domain
MTMTKELTVKPSFFWDVYLARRLFQDCFFAIWLSLLASFLLNFWGLYAWWPVCAAILIAGVFISAVIFGRRAYQHTDYVIRQKTIEMNVGWGVRQTTIIHFSDLDHVVLEQAPLQKRHGIGSLALVTSALPAAPRLVDVANPEDVFALVNERCRHERV